MNILRLKEVLREKKMSGKELSEKVEVSQNAISNITQGYSFPKSELLIRIAEVLEVDVRELLISTKSRDLSDPTEAIKEILKIAKRVDRDSI